LARRPTGYYFTLDSSGRVPTYLNGTQVIINGKSAPLLYTSLSQINAIVPYEIEGQRAATVQALFYGLSQVWSTPVAPRLPSFSRWIQPEPDRRRCSIRTIP
jgi:uncharacterized protein (TIGR03437 family)